MVRTSVWSDARLASLVWLFLVLGLCLVVVPRETALGEIHHLRSETTKTNDDHMRLGVDFYVTDELEKAIEEFQAATGHRSGYAQAYHNLGVSMAKAGDLTGAIEAWTQAKIEMGPNGIPMEWIEHESLLPYLGG